MAVTIQIKRGLHADIPVLAEGELGFETDTYDVFIGDGAVNHQINPSPTNVGAVIHGVDEKTTMHADDEFAFIDSEAADVLKKLKWSTIKTYIDESIVGVDLKQPVRVATTVAGTLASSFENGDTVDGVVLATGDRILVKNQADAKENGIYVVKASGAPDRSPDANVDAEVTHGMLCFVLEGDTNGNQGWMLVTADPITLGVTELTFEQFSSIGGGATTFVGLSDTPADYTDDGLKIVRVNVEETALEFVSFTDTYLDNTPGGTDDETGKAPTSDVMYEHGIATTGIHGAGENTILHSGSTIDGGTFV